MIEFTWVCTFLKFNWSLFLFSILMNIFIEMKYILIEMKYILLIYE